MIMRGNNLSSVELKIYQFTKKITAILKLFRDIFSRLKYSYGLRYFEIKAFMKRNEILKQIPWLRLSYVTRQ